MNMCPLPLPAAQEVYQLFPASPTNSVITFSRMPSTTFTIQAHNMPGLSLNTAKISAPGGQQVNFIPDRVSYAPLSVRVLIDEQLIAFRELHRWMNGITGGYDQTELTLQFTNDERDAHWREPAKLTVNDVGITHAAMTVVSGSRAPLLRVLFSGVIPTSIGEIQFDTTATDTTQPLVTSVTFEYDYYTFVDIRRA